MTRPTVFKTLYRLTLALAVVFLVAFVVTLAGCTAAQADRGAQVVSGLQAATTQPYVTVPVAATGPYGELVLGIFSGVLGLAAMFFKSQQSAAQAHLDTAKAATGTQSNAAATASLVNNLDTTAVPVPVPTAPVVATKPV